MSETADKLINRKDFEFVDKDRTLFCPYGI